MMMQFLLTTSKLGNNSFAKSEYLQSDYDNYLNPDKNFYNTINVDCSFYSESQFSFNSKNKKILKLKILKFIYMY